MPGLKRDKTTYKLDETKFNEAYNGFISTLLFASFDDDIHKKLMESEEEPPLSDALKNHVEKRLNAFFSKLHDKIGDDGINSLDIGQVGADFFYVSEGHGVGFADRMELSEEMVDILNKITEEFPAPEPYFGDDGMIYISSEIVKDVP